MFLKKKKQACLKRSLNLFHAPCDEFRVRPPEQDLTEQSQPRQTRESAWKSGGCETGEWSQPGLVIKSSPCHDRGEGTQPPSLTSTQPYFISALIRGGNSWGNQGRGYDITNSPPDLLSRPLIPNGFYGSRVVNKIPGLLFHIDTDTFSKIKKIWC